MLLILYGERAKREKEHTNTLEIADVRFANPMGVNYM